jgi:HK97 gp10 family phage protein
MASEVKVSVAGLDAAFSEIVDAFKKDIEADSKKAVSKAGREMAQELQSTSPKQTGEYASGWKARIESDGYGGTVATVYNARKPSLTHLLEFGHGGPQPAPAHEHIAPAEAKGRNKLLEALRA